MSTHVLLGKVVDAEAVLHSRRPVVVLVVILGCRSRCSCAVAVPAPARPPHLSGRTRTWLEV